MQTVALTAAALVAFASNSLLCRMALGQGSIDAASFSTIRLIAGACALAAISAAQGSRARAAAGSYAERLGAPLWADQTREELGRIGGRAPSRDALTTAERRIAELVAEGRTNRDVAAALFLTEHSVETALSRIYRKLGVHSRTELAHRLSVEES